MEHRPPESLKTFANRLAERVYNEDGRQLSQMFRLAGLMGDSPDVLGATASPDDPGGQSLTSSRYAPDKIGIWERKQENGKAWFVRAKDMLRDWHYWANIDSIAPKEDCIRVLLLGESVARGYLYDPQFTPAFALEKILQSQLGQERVEVIDLARSEMGFEVSDLALAALQLEPDAVVIFSGNNWRWTLPKQMQDAVKIDALLHQEGMAGLMRLAEKQLGELVAGTVRTLASGCQSRGIPVLWIVPEFNLTDWRDPLIGAPHLDGQKNRQWLESEREARAALENGDLVQATELADTMMGLDGGTSVVPLYILGECHRRKRDLARCRKYLEMARDSVIWDSSKSASPRAHSITQKLLREHAEACGNEIIDTPCLYAEYLQGDIPDRRIFLDYCHLTYEGIQVTMAAAASSLLRSLKKKDVPWRELIAKAPTPSREVEAEASFLAAVHNAHWWQSEAVVRYYCMRAVRFSWNITKLMECFIEFQTRRAPMLMSSAAEQIAALRSPLINRYLLRYNSHQLDPVLLAAIVSALREAGIDAQKKLDELRRLEHSASKRKINLLDYYYCSAGLQPQEVVWVLPKRDPYVRKQKHYRAYSLESRLVVVAENNSPVKLELTCRVPGSAHGQPNVTLAFNGELLGEITVGSKWETWDVVVPGECVKEGVNKISIRWPMPEFQGRDGYDGVMHDLLEGNIPAFFTVFGEIHMFTASDARHEAKPGCATEQEHDVVAV
jgi:hypothetical protein